MRNLKRALSLALASVMLLGMMVVGTSAASYTDVDEKDNVEAIEVLNAVNVMIGRQGNFEPDEPVNRHEMAVIMAKLYLGVDTADNYVGSHPYTDVVPWADKYVAACYENDLISGTSSTTFSGNQDVTAVQAALMVLRALGYKDLNKGAADWRAPVTAMANQIRLFSGVASNPSEKLNRNQVAQLVLNALKSPVVDLKDNTFDVSSGDGQVVITGGSREYIVRSSYEAYARAINRTEIAGTSASQISGYTIELGEHLYNGKLKLNTNAKDKFGRPSNNWQYDGKDVGTYVNNDLKVAEYTKKVTGADLYDLLTYTTINDNDLLTWLDGVKSNVSKNDLVRSNKKAVNSSGTGVLTEVFVDLDHDEVTISSINTYLAKANSDYNSTNETLSLKVYNSATGTTKTVDVKDVPAAAGVKKDDYKLVYMSGWDNASYDVVNIFDTEILSDSEVTKWSKDSTKVLDTLTTGGQEYSSNVKAFYDKIHVFEDYNQQLLTDNTYNIYLDRYGNVIGVDLHEGTKNYVFITGYDRIGSNISIKTADAAAIFMDGTMEVITVNVTDTNKNIDAADGTIDQSDDHVYFEFWQNHATNGKRNENRWYTYTVNSAGVYTLTPAKYTFATDYRSGATWKETLDCANLYVDDNGTVAWDDNVGINPINSGTGDRALGEDASIYITVDTDRVDTSVDPTDTITDVNGVYTGAQDVKLELSQSTQNKVPNAVYTVYDADGYIIAAIVLGEAQGAATNYAYMLGEAKNERIEREGSTRAAGDVTYYWEFDAVYEGEKQTLQAKTKFPGSLLVNKYTVQELRFTGDYVTDVKTVDSSKFQTTNKNNGDIADMKVYDVGQVVGADWASNTSGNLDNTNKNLNNTDSYPNAADANARIGAAGEATVYLQGRTLYTKTGGVRDIGLALARDAKAVTIQMEDGERTVTNHASVDGAIDRLSDRNDAADGVQFKGRIVAVLDGRGVAEWVVFISDTELVTGKDPSYGGGGNGGNVENEVAFLTGASAEAKYTISKTGVLKLNLTYTAPDFAVKKTSAVAGSKVTLPSINVYEGTTWIDTITLGSPANVKEIGADGKAVFSYTSLKGDFDEDNVTNPNNLTFKLTATETLDKVVVKYVDASTGKDVPVTAASTKEVKVDDLTAASGSNGIKVAIDETKDTYALSTIASVTGITLNDGTLDTSTDIGADASEDDIFSDVDGSSGTAASVNGTDFVTVKITLGAATPKPVTYKVSTDKLPAAIRGAVAGTPTGVTLDKFGVSGATTDTLAITIDTVSGIAKGGKVNFSAALGAAAADNFSYDITVKTNQGNVELKGVKNDSSPVAADLLAITADVEVTAVTVKANPIPKIVSAALDEKNPAKMEVTFNIAVAKASDGTTALDAAIFVLSSNGGVTISRVETKDNKTFTLIFDGAIANGTVATVTYTAVSAAGDTNNKMKDGSNAKTTITVNLTAGTATVAQAS